MANTSNFSASTDGASVSGTVTDKQIVTPQVPAGLRSDGPRVTFNFRGAWDSGNTYYYYDVVRDTSGRSWICRYPQVPAGTALEEGEYWTNWADPNIEFEELAQLVEKYVGAVKFAVKHYNKVSDMQADSSLNINDVCYCDFYNAPTINAKFIVTNDTPNGIDKVAISNSLTATLLIDREIYVNNFGCYGNGVNDDYQYIKRAIEVATENVVSKPTATGTTYNILPVIFSANKYAVSNGFEITETVSISGSGIESVLIPLNTMPYIFYIHNETGKTQSVNEENLLLAPQIKNICFDGNARTVKISECVKFEFCDNLTLYNIWFKSLDGTCISFGTVRESNINNIFTRFSGAYDKPVINIYKKEGDNSNLSFFTNMSIIFPFSNAINCSDSNYTCNNVLVHGLFDSIIKSLADLFPKGETTYNSEANYIHLVNSECVITNANLIYIPGNGSGLYIDETSKCAIYNSNINGVNYTAGNPCAIENNGKLTVDNLNSSIGYDYKILKNNSGSVYGQLYLQSQTTTDDFTATCFSDNIEMRSYNGAQKVNRCNYLLNLENSAFEILHDRYTGSDNSKDLGTFHQYVMQYQNATLFAIDNKAAFAIPTYDSETYSIMSSYFNSDLMDGLIYIKDGHLYAIINKTETLIK